MNLNRNEFKNITFKNIFRSLLVIIVFGNLFLSGALAAVEPQWLTLDTNADGTTETIASTNLQDVAFNNCGEIVGWYVKTVKGTDFKGKYEKQPNFITEPSAVVLAPTITGKCIAATPITNKNAAGQLSADFAYTQGAAQVTKKFIVEPRRLTIKLDVSVKGPSKYDLEFFGMGGGATESKALAGGANQPLALGDVQNAVYTSLQCCNSALGATGQAMIVQPLGVGDASVGKRTLHLKTERGDETRERNFMALHLSGQQSLRLYGGANELIRLSQEGYAQLPGLFKANVFGEISLQVVRILEWLRQQVGSWGLAIILFSVLIRLVQWPLMQSSAKSMTATQSIQPLVNKLKEQYKDNPQKLNEETMKLYQEKGVNPVGGCLPMLVPMPVLIVLWRVFSNYEFDQGFLWLHDLSLPDGLKILGVLYILVNFATLWVNTRANPDMFRQQLPFYVMYIFWAFNFPAGVTLYWIITMILGVVQQDLVNRRYQLGNYAPADVKAAQAASLKNLMSFGRPTNAKTIDTKLKDEKPKDQKPQENKGNNKKS